MGMITRCPACATAFKVVPDQLRVSDGWVRCGQCGEVFDAALDLHEAGAQPVDVLLEPESGPPGPAAGAEPGPEPALEPKPEPEPEPEPDAPVSAEDAEDVSVEAALAWIEASAPELPVTDPVGSMELGGMPGAQEAWPSEPVFAPQPANQPEPEPPAIEPFLPPLAAEDPVRDDADGRDAPQDEAVSPAEEAEAAPGLGLESESDLETETEEEAEEEAEAAPVSDEPAAMQDDGDAAPAGTAPLLLRPAVEPAYAPAEAFDDAPVRTAPLAAAPPPAPTLPQVSFIRPEPPAEPAWRRALRRALWVLAGVTLAGALLLQVVLHERDALAAAVPSAKPWLQALCRAAGCSVQPLRRIDAIAIDDASFTALPQDGYRLQLTLHNRADQALALPAIELSLTDVQEQPVLRRVLLPAELGAVADELPAHGAWSATVDLAVADNAGRARIVGYRLLPFYP